MHKFRTASVQEISKEQIYEVVWKEKLEYCGGGGYECGKYYQKEDRRWEYRDCSGELVSVCGVRECPGVALWLLQDIFMC